MPAVAHPALERLPPGWFHHGAQILELVEQHRPQVVVELGTHLGASAIAVGRVIRAWGGVIYCVDTWAGRPQRHSPMTKLHACAHNLKVCGVQDRVRLIVATTAEAAAAWRGPIDYLYIDADHSRAGCRADLEAWTPHVRSGGLVAGDDYGHLRCPGVKLAWDDFEREHGWTFTRSLTPNTNPPGMSLIYGVKP